MKENYIHVFHKSYIQFAAFSFYYIFIHSGHYDVKLQVQYTISKKRNLGDSSMFSEEKLDIAVTKEEEIIAVTFPRIDRQKEC